ncbi:MAG: tetratricopeptide repeat protein [bacterium]|nr:tetratricopeptide repeat protein [bacterium]
MERGYRERGWRGAGGRGSARLVLGVVCASVMIGWVCAGTNEGGVAHAIARRYFNEGLGHVQGGKYQQAMRSFRQAIAYDRSIAEAYLNLGACYEQLGRFEEGRPYYERAIALDGENAQLRYLYGMALGRNGDMRGAVEQLERAVYLAPRNMDYLYNLGVAYVGATQYVLAARCFEQVGMVVTNRGAVWYNLGLTRLRLGQTNEAEEAFARVELDGECGAAAQYQLGMVAYARGDYRGAVERAKLAGALDPGLWEANVLRAEGHAGLGEYGEACRVLERVYLLQATSDLGKKLAKWYKAWGAIAQSNGEYRVALDRYRQAVRFEPGDGWAYVAAAECAAAVGDVGGAREELERARRHAREGALHEAIERVEDKLREVGKGVGRGE